MGYQKATVSTHGRMETLSVDNLDKAKSTDMEFGRNQALIPTVTSIKENTKMT